MTRVSGVFMLLSLVFLTLACSKSKFPGTDLPKDLKLTDKKQVERDYYFMTGQRQYLLGSYPVAIQAFEETIKLDPNCDACYYQLANIYYAARQYDKALQMSEKAYAIDSANFYYQQQLSQLYAVTGNFGSAIAIYRKFYLTQSNPDIYLDMSDLYAAEGLYVPAIRLIDSCLQRFGYDESIALKKQPLYYKLNLPQNALIDTKEQLKKNPNSPRLYAVMGENYTTLNADSLAYQAYQHSLSLDSTYAPAQLGLSEYFRKKNYFADYFAVLGTYFSNTKVDASSKSSYFKFLLNFSEFMYTFQQPVDTLFLKARTVHPASNSIDLEYSGFLIQSGRIDSSKAVLNNILKRDSLYTEAWSIMLSIDFYLKNWDDLLTHSQQAVKSNPKSTEFQTFNGMANWQLKNYPPAVTAFEEALKYSADTATKVQSLAMLGDLYHEMNDEKKSFYYYEEVLKLDPDNLSTLNNYAYFLSLTGKKLDKALAMSKKTINIEPTDAAYSTYLDTYAWILYKLKRYDEAKTMLRSAISYGKSQSATILEHYADVLYELKEYDLAEIYWEKALEAPDCDNPEEIKAKLNKLKK